MPNSNNRIEKSKAETLPVVRTDIAPPPPNVVNQLKRRFGVPLRIEKKFRKEIREFCPGSGLPPRFEKDFSGDQRRWPAFVACRRPPLLPIERANECAIWHKAVERQEALPSVRFIQRVLRVLQNHMAVPETERYQQQLALLNTIVNDGLAQAAKWGTVHGATALDLRVELLATDYSSPSGDAGEDDYKPPFPPAVVFVALMRLLQQQKYVPTASEIIAECRKVLAEFRLLRLQLEVMLEARTNADTIAALPPPPDDGNIPF